MTIVKLTVANNTATTTYWDEVRRFDSAEGNVAKFVFEKEKGGGLGGRMKPAVVEAVLYKYPTYEDRTVVCCSTQSGCVMGCRFCGAGDYFLRSLTSAEIVDQVQHAVSQTGINSADIRRFQIMFMSMGEPALNQTHVASAIRQLHALYPNAELLLSSSGPDVSYKKIFDVSREVDVVGLQFSIHESTDEARNNLIPFKKKMDLQKIAAIGVEWFAVTGRKPFFNYCAHDNNSLDEDADRIRALFDPRVWEATISVVCERNEGLPTRNEHQIGLARDFAEKLLWRGFNTRVFDPAGQDDIGGGCGQLWYVQDVMTEFASQGLARETIGHGKPIVHVPCTLRR